mgnify:CR=1 FL=1
MNDSNKTLLPIKDGEPQDFSLQIALAMLIFLFALGFAERTINFSDPLQGLILHAAILVGIILYAAARWDHSQHRYLLGLSIVPIMRIVGLVVPLAHIPLKYWFILVNLIFFVAVLLLVQRLALNRCDLGIKLKGWPGQLLVGLSGILIGAGQFFLIGPSISSDPMRTFPNALVGAVLMLGNGFVEELAFRGMLQYIFCLLYTSPSPRDRTRYRMPSSA